MKKLSKDTKLMLIDLFFHIGLIAIPLILIIAAGGVDIPVLFFLFFLTLGIFCLYSFIFTIYCLSNKGNLLKIFIPRIFISSIVGGPILTPAFTGLVTIPHVIIMIIGYIIKLIKEKNLYTKKDITVFILTIALSLITACLSFIFMENRSILLLMMLTASIIGLLHGILSFIALKKFDAWFYSFLIISFFPICSALGALTGILITKLVIYLKNRNKKQLNEAQSENDG